MQGNFRPVQIENADLPCQVVQGEIPANLDLGQYIRNGPNQMFPNSGPSHWMDGGGHLHKVRFVNGKAYYSNIYIKTDLYKAECKWGGRVISIDTRPEWVGSCSQAWDSCVTARHA